MSQILDFYRGQKVNSCRYYLSDVWTFSHQRLENVHDYIQWMFPLDEPSAHNPDAPILTKEDIEEFRSDNTLRWRLMLSVHTFMRFLLLTPGQWITRFDHNHLRITRMLKCLMLAGMESEARARFDEFMVIAKAYGAEETLARAIEFWSEAVGITGQTEFTVELPETLCGGGCGKRVPYVVRRPHVCDECMAKIAAAYKSRTPTLDLSTCKDCGKKLPSRFDGKTGGNISLPRDMVCDECWNSGRYDACKDEAVNV